MCLFAVVFLQAVFELRLKELSVAVPLMCCAADMISVPSRKQVVLVGSKSSAELNNMLCAAHSVYDPNKTVKRLLNLIQSSQTNEH